MEDNNTQYRNKKKNWYDYPRYMGKVIKWFPDRGYGFIKCWEDGNTYYAHARASEDGTLFLGSIVEFGIMQDRNDPDKFSAAHIQTVEVPEREH